MAVSLPTSADVRKLREQAADQVEAARAPLMAVLGAGDQAVTAVNKALARARTRAEAVQKRIADLPTGVEDLRVKLTMEEIRKAAEEWRTQATKYYEDLAKHGEQTWEELRRQPRVRKALDAIESYTEKLDTQVDEFVDEAHDAAQKALGVVTGKTRATAESVTETVDEAAEPVAEAAEKTDGKAAVAEKTDGKAAVAEKTEGSVKETAEKADGQTTAADKAADKAAEKPATKTSTRGTASRRPRSGGTASN